MTDKKSNTDHLHEEGIIKKEDLTQEHIESIDALSQEEIEQLKAISKKVNKDNKKGVGIFL